jgi:hypothetical protein
MYKSIMMCTDTLYIYIFESIRTSILMVALGTIGFFLSIAIIIYLVVSVLLFSTFTPRVAVQTSSVQGSVVSIPPRGSATGTANCPTGTVVTGVGYSAKEGTVVQRVDFAGSQAKVDGMNPRQDGNSFLQAIAFCSHVS